MKEEKRNNELMPILPEAGKSLENDDFKVEIVNNNLEEGMECFNHWLFLQDEDIIVMVILKITIELRIYN